MERCVQWTAAWGGREAGQGRRVVANQTSLLSDVQLFALLLPQRVLVPFLCLVPGNSLSLCLLHSQLLPTSRPHVSLSFSVLSLSLSQPLWGGRQFLPSQRSPPLRFCAILREGSSGVWRVGACLPSFLLQLESDDALTS